MNIFVLSLCPSLCAKYHNDKHVVKMILEYAQLLCTAHHELDNNPNSNLYKSAFKNHPCAIWVRESSGNYCWLYILFKYLCKEYTYRYSNKLKKKHHMAEIKLLDILHNVPSNIPFGNITKFPQAMPDDVKHNNSIIAYKQYYNKYKRPFCKWRKRNIPYWFEIN
jgi:hypothetical protein